MGRRDPIRAVTRGGRIERSVPRAVPGLFDRDPLSPSNLGHGDAGDVDGQRPPFGQRPAKLLVVIGRRPQLVIDVHDTGQREPGRRCERAHQVRQSDRIGAAR